MSAECSEVRMAQSAAEIAACYHVMKQLRQDQPCMADAAAFTSTVQRMQQQEGFCLAYLVQPNTDRVVAVAGYRIGESLFNGKQLYVQDLVTDAEQRSRGYGQILLSWLREQAAAHNCNRLWLTSGAQRLDAHRFYEANGLVKMGYAFIVNIQPNS